MEKLEFLVQGSSPEPYHVQFVRSNGQLHASCTCKAGAVGQVCKHRLQILAGLNPGVLGDASALPLVIEWLQGTDLQEALLELEMAEVALAEAKRGVASQKKKLSRIMSAA